jgi:hypothetical protein
MAKCVRCLRQFELRYKRLNLGEDVQHAFFLHTHAHRIPLIFTFFKENKIGVKALVSIAKQETANK